MSTQPEAKLKTAIVDALRALGVLTLRNEQGRRRYKLFGLGPGSPDILCILRPTGRVLGVEVKMPGEKARPNQIAWGETVCATGAGYVVVTSVKEAVEAVRKETTR